MNKHLQDDWADIRNSYQLSANLEQIKSIGSGHINDTFLIPGIDKNWVLQRLNTFVFENPLHIQHNFDQVSNHLSKQQYPLSVLSVKASAQGHSLCRVNNNFWRLVPEIPNSQTVEIASNAEEAFNAATAIGQFDQALTGLSPDSLHIIIPGFHDLSLRLSQLQESLTKNHQNRISTCSDELALVERFKGLADWQYQSINSKKLPLRVTHNDTKISNVLLDNVTGKARSVIDWDTVMPGHWLFDYGDMVRSFTPSNAEDSSLDMPLEIRWDILQALTEGFLDACNDNLSAFEKENLLVGAKIIIFMIGVRFLTDYLNGDVYFKTQRQSQNLDRCRTQFRLLKQLNQEHNNWQKKLGLTP